MTHVAATANNIDLAAICDDETCAQKGKTFGEHTVVHKSVGTKKGLRGECPDCKGPLHNMKDDAKLIAFSCIWRQAFGDNAKKTPVTGASLRSAADAIHLGNITHWADRSLLAAVLAPKAVAGSTPATSASPVAKAGSTASSAGSARSQATTPPAAPTAGSSVNGSATTAQPATGATSPSHPSAGSVDPDKRKKLSQYLKAGKVTP